MLAPHANMQNSAARPFQHPTDTNTNTSRWRKGGGGEAERGETGDKVQPEERDRRSSHSSSTSTAAGTRRGCAPRSFAVAPATTDHLLPWQTIWWEPCLHCIATLSRNGGTREKKKKKSPSVTPAKSAPDSSLRLFLYIYIYSKRTVL